MNKLRRHAAAMGTALAVGLSGCVTAEAPTPPIDMPVSTELCRSIDRIGNDLGMYANVPAPAGRDVMSVIGGQNEDGTMFYGMDVVTNRPSAETFQQELTSAGLDPGARSHKSAAQIADLSLRAADEVHAYLKNAPKHDDIEALAADPYFLPEAIDKTGASTSLYAGRVAVQTFQVEYCGRNLANDYRNVDPKYAHLVPTGDAAPRPIFPPRQQ